MTSICYLLIFLFSAAYGQNVAPPWSLYLVDPYLGYRMKPNMRAESPEGNPPIVYETNSFGYRDREFVFDKPSILVVGNSRTFGDGINVEERWTSLLQKDYPQYNVYNASVVGTSSEETMLQIQSEGERLVSKARLVIMELQVLTPDGIGCRLFSSRQWGKPKVQLLRRGQNFEVLPIDVTSDGLFFQDHQTHGGYLDDVFGTSPVNPFSRAYLRATCAIKYAFFKREYWRSVRLLLQKMADVPAAYGVPVLFLTHERNVYQVLKALKLPVFWVKIKNKRKYIVNPTVGHLNGEGNRILYGMIRDNLERQSWWPLQE